MSGMHFERIASDYASSRPPYPQGLYDLLKSEGVIGPGKRVLEVGAGSGLATRDVIRAGAEVVAVEPGADLAALLASEGEVAAVIGATLEEAALPPPRFDSVLAATSMHWVDLSIGLPKLHAALRPGGWLAVWRHRFDDPSIITAFRRRVQEIADARPDRGFVSQRRNSSTMEDLAAGGWFEPVRTEQWRWSIALDTDRIRRLFRSFPEWTDAEVGAVAKAVDDLGGIVTEHYQTVLNLLRRSTDR